MTMYARNIEYELLEWKNKSNRKPLVLRGARQVGKTTVVNNFSAHYKQYIYLNLEIATDAKPFNVTNTIEQLVESIFFLHNKDIQEQDTLLFIDEIQAVPKAINSLRYFYEKLPWLHVIAAGSLLETLLNENVQIPVGRVEYKVVRPVSFSEFLQVIQETNALKEWANVPLKAFAYDKLLQLYHTYALIGGMPEVVQHYAINRNLTALTSIYSGLMEAYRNDVEKYAKNSSMVQALRHAIEALPLQAGFRIKFQGFGQSNYGSREMGEALRTLEQTMLMQLIYPTTSTHPPLLPDKRKAPRLQFLDTGLLNFYAGLQHQMLGIEDIETVYKGRVAEHLTGQEIMAAQTDVNFKLLFWVREKKQSSAEVDFVIMVDGMMVPVEVKSGATGSLRSLHQLMDLLEHPYAIRLYAGPLKIDQLKTVLGKEYFLLNLPYFLAGKLTDYLIWLKENNPILH